MGNGVCVHAQNLYSGALTRVALWVGHCPTNRKVAGSIPGQGTCLGCGPGPQLGGVPEAADPCFSRILMLLSLSLKISKIFKKREDYYSGSAT